MRDGRLHPHPDGFGDGAQHSYLADLRQARFKKAPAVLVVEILIVGDNISSQGLIHHGLSRHLQQGRGREIGFPDQAGFAKCEVAHRRHVIQVEIPLAQRFQILLRPTQFLVLHLQFDMLSSQFFLDLLAFGDVLRNAKSADQFAFGIEFKIRLFPNPSGCAMGDDPVFDIVIRPPKGLLPFRIHKISIVRM